ncbi:thiazolylpeptide-type bacteriocin [Sphaerimonospora sp. CA-214678]|uniref:thiazolylpeptide-type bacteriocin n=1 Tax=Sphaerimonospora sp. CA-214678 TaxID=3240029 RepID=UPI003D9404B5
MNNVESPLLRDELSALEAETFEIQDYGDGVAEELGGSTSTSSTSCCSSCTSTGSTSCTG